MNVVVLICFLVSLVTIVVAALWTVAVSLSGSTRD
jgi:hypothetical protein